MSTCLLVQVSVFTNDINNLRNKKEKERNQLERLTRVQCSILNTFHFCSGVSIGTAEQKKVKGFLLWSKFNEYNYVQ